MRAAAPPSLSVSQTTKKRGDSHQGRSPLAQAAALPPANPGQIRPAGLRPSVFSVPSVFTQSASET